MNHTGMNRIAGESPMIGHHHPKQDFDFGGSILLSIHHLQCDVITTKLTSANLQSGEDELCMTFSI